MITLTARAVEKVKQLQEEDELDAVLHGKTAKQEVLRVAVRPGGCSGLSYDLHFSALEDGDWIGQFDGVSVVVDIESAPYLDGVVLDFKESLSGSGFVFNNPSATRSCGCGSSFS